MKTIIAIPENKEEWKAVWKKNKKKLFGLAIATGAFVAGAVVKGRMDSADISESNELPFLPEAEENEEEFTEEPEENDEEESEEGDGAE